MKKQYKIFELMNRSDIEIPFIGFGSKFGNQKKSNKDSKIMLKSQDEYENKFFCFNSNSPSYSGAVNFIRYLIQIF